MNEHLGTWIDLYLDGELPAQKMQEIEKHLAQCPECRLIAERRRVLSDLLHTYPAQDVTADADAFASKIYNRLEVRQKEPNLRGFLRIGWQLVPFVLLFALVFLRALSFAGTLVNLLPGGGEFLQTHLAQPVTIMASPNLLKNELGGFVFELLERTGFLRLINWDWGTIFAAIVATGLLYSIWCVAWLMTSQQSRPKIS